MNKKLKEIEKNLHKDTDFLIRCQLTNAFDEGFDEGFKKGYEKAFNEITLKKTPNE